MNNKRFFFQCFLCTRVLILNPLATFVGKITVYLLLKQPQQEKNLNNIGRYVKLEKCILSYTIMLNILNGLTNDVIMVPLSMMISI